MKTKSVIAKVKQHDCAGCMACIDSCPCNALGYKIDKNGYIRIVISKKLCINCGRCSRICPALHPYKHTNSTLTSNAYAAWNNNLEQRKNSASGGIFAAIASYFISTIKGVVYGAAIDGFEIKHIRVDNIDDIKKLQGSKYQASSLIGIYKSVKQDLDGNKYVLFSGLSCQINGLLNFLKNTPTQNLYTIDSICGGISTILPMLDLQNEHKYIAIKSFRDKENKGWKSTGYQYNLKMINIDGEENNLGSNNLVIQSFSSRILKRESCLSCKYAGIVRSSDCTVGDYWGYDNHIDEQKYGISAIIIHSEKMKEIIDNANITKYKSTIYDIAKSNSNLFFNNFKLVKYFISRQIAFILLKHRYNSIVKKLISYTSLWGIENRLYQRYIGRKIRNELSLLSNK